MCDLSGGGEGKRGSLVEEGGRLNVLRGRKNGEGEKGEKSSAS